MRRSAHLLRAHVVAVVAAGAVVAVVCAFRLTGLPPLVATQLVLLIVFGVLYTVAEAFPIRVYSRADAGSFTTSDAFAFALLLSVPLPVVLLVIPVGSLLGDLRSHRPLHRSLFNASMQVLAFGAGGVVLETLLGQSWIGPTDPVGGRLLGGLVVACIAMYLVNVVLTGTAIALDQRIRVSVVLKEDFAPIDLLSRSMLLALAPVFVIVTQRSLVLAPLLLVTIMAVYRNTQAALRRQHESLHDQLTGLPNRRMLDNRIEEVAAAARRAGESFAVLLLDLDRFKEVNDTLGHHIGDELLIQVADRLRGIPTIDTVARLGGDEFAIIVSPADDRVARAAAQRILAEVARPFVVQEFPLHIGVSVGISLFPDHSEDVPAIFRRADAAMYAAKRSGVGFGFAVAQCDPVGPGRVMLLAQLLEAIAAGDVEVEFQPQTDARTGAATGFEALTRWRHPELGMIPPSEFMPMVEHTELIGDLTHHVLTRSLAAAAEWRSAGHRVPVAVNVSARDLQDLRLPDRIRELLDAAGLPADALELEITENALMTDHLRAGQVLEDLRALGVRLAIDDFGTGYSSLAHLRALPVQTLKIDRTFVHDVATSREDALIVQSIVDLAHTIGMSVVAEGIEDLATLELLARQGCDHAQGYLISPPLGADQVLPWLDSHEPIVACPPADGLGDLRMLPLRRRVPVAP